MKKLNLLLFGVICWLSAAGQDYMFSQPWLSPIYLNPAAIGSGEGDWRFSAMYRMQYQSLPSSMRNIVVSAEKYFPEKKVGAGLLLSSSNEGYLAKDAVYAVASKTFCAKEDAALNLEGSYYLTLAAQFGFVNRRIDYSKLVFSDQLGPGGIIPGLGTEANLPGKSGAWYFDAAAGAVLGIKVDNAHFLSAGLSAHHINRADESLLSTNNGYLAKVPVRWTFNMAYVISIDDPWTWTPEIIYYYQAGSNAFQAGCEHTWNNIGLSCGLWYRSPLSKIQTGALVISAAFVLGGKGDKSSLRVAGAYDYYTGGNTYTHSGGSTEFGLLWDTKSGTSSGDQCKPVFSPWKCPL